MIHVMVYLFSLFRPKYRLKEIKHPVSTRKNSRYYLMLIDEVDSKCQQNHIDYEIIEADRRSLSKINGG